MPRAWKARGEWNQRLNSLGLALEGLSSLPARHVPAGNEFAAWDTALPFAAAAYNFLRRGALTAMALRRVRILTVGSVETLPSHLDSSLGHFRISFSLW